MKYYYVFDNGSVTLLNGFSATKGRQEINQIVTHSLGQPSKVVRTPGKWETGRFIWTDLEQAKALKVNRGTDFLVADSTSHVYQCKCSDILEYEGEVRGIVLNDGISKNPEGIKQSIEALKNYDA